MTDIRFEWDAQKDLSNQNKHDISFLMKNLKQTVPHDMQVAKLNISIIKTF